MDKVRKRITPELLANSQLSPVFLIGRLPCAVDKLDLNTVRFDRFWDKRTALHFHRLVPLYFS